MSDQQRDNAGALFLNKHRQSDKAPDYVGTIHVGGREMEISAWVKDDRSGEFLSLKVQPSSASSQKGRAPRYQRRPTPEQVARAEAQRARMMR
ncbi:hypothetical protein AA13595_0044 [Gluconacetobacter johannae DSM 13595]|uniref:Uncharacterized protein n=1 Tax=Gluconacetobacter johannae TaxID=112140 RepID=A0A7W4J8P2_9PROT|nr:hypothetical protein [Gluconacetobacter johannae]MBB2176752.1 hypothetical protein [Gluconacetobacter johannae]GBQ79509.1 hypothetical protein AA13595_0044 [Gluconacetobacter johannae DSM 13595]